MRGFKNFVSLIFFLSLLLLSITPLNTPLPAYSLTPSISNNLDNSESSFLSSLGTQNGKVYALVEGFSKEACAINLARSDCAQAGHTISIKTLDIGSSKQEYSAIVAGNISISGSAAPQLAISQNNIYVAWTDLVLPGKNSAVFWSMSRNEGVTFSSPIKISSSSNLAPQFLVQLLAVDNNVYVLLNGANKNVFFVSSNDRGLTFSEPLKLDNATGNDDHLLLRPFMAAFGNNVYISWIDVLSTRDFTSPRTDSIIVRHSSDYGKSFDSPITLQSVVSKTRVSLLNLKVIASDSSKSVYAAWQDNCEGSCNRLYFSYSINNETTWSGPKLITEENNTTIGEETPLYLHANGDDVCIFYGVRNSEGNDLIYLIASHNDGQTFSSTTSTGAINLGDSLSNLQTTVHFASEKTKILLTWIQKTNGATAASETSYDVYLKAFENCKSVQDAPKNISQGSTAFKEKALGGSAYPLPVKIPLPIISDANEIVAWQGNTGAKDIRLAISQDQGKSFASAIVVAPEFISGGSIVLVSTLAIVVVLINRYRLK